MPNFSFTRQIIQILVENKQKPYTMEPNANLIKVYF